MFCRHPQCLAGKGVITLVIGAAWLLDSIAAPGTKAVLGWQWYSYVGLIVLLHGLMILAAAATGHGLEREGKKK
ncbi:hypothetical protein HYS54_00460 [Candidatus Micrarchaeota archaeon]|nr:hypothetical protein [Candidatus Micrarchaeota archaeon]